MTHDVEDEHAAPGWDAIDAALSLLYPGVEPRHVGYLPPAAFSANLQGCSSYPAAGHWHYVTYGLSELYTPGPDDDREWSGWGFELTLRVVRGSEDEAPGWPFTVLNHLANFINGQGVLVEDGHRMDLRQPVTGHPHTDGPDTGLTVFAFTVDPQLDTIDTPNGKVTFYQAVGVTPEEKTRMQQASTRQVLDQMTGSNPLLVTDPARA
ncbi:suppressor of fused domain protein [Micromonospora sp. WMMD812]|uniref:suppressor of fused domain protein n=1 Tax=Micromonospora sp. WMMD812 TaxID=3015152 RepID=UPI00248B1A50|nr:suppressor of fused domain protein [Micromonospora sp. WMMD812]WBB65367.1 suppressor of fused domain protein [Micromonospora sp. WMMD812]